MPQNHQKKYWGLTRCHGNSILDINISLTVSHRPCFYSILMKFEANWVKVRWWIQSILKMTHFLLPVGGAITLPHNCHIDAIGFIHRTNHWSVIKIRQCMWTLLDTSCISILAITSSPRHRQTVRNIKWRFSTAWYGTVRYGTVHFWGVFHWVLYLVPDTFLVPLRSRFHRAVPLPKRDV